MKMILNTNPGLWKEKTSIPACQYACGFCGSLVASKEGWQGFFSRAQRTLLGRILICPFCSQPTFFKANGEQFPGILAGTSVKDVPEGITNLYDEARRATGATSYTAAVLCCRKILMHVAVSKGSKEKNSFEQHVQYLSINNYIQRDAESWVDHIRKKGNEANHQIVISSREEAEEMIRFVEMLLKALYEYPAAANEARKEPESKPLKASSKKEKKASNQPAH